MNERQMIAVTSPCATPEETLPRPRLTAHIARPVAKGALGRVTIVGDPAVARPQGGEVGRANRPLRCTRCHELGHARNNRRCPARAR